MIAFLALSEDSRASSALSGIFDSIRVRSCAHLVVRTSMRRPPRMLARPPLNVDYRSP
jgi:hypothetical protein